MRKLTPDQIITISNHIKVMNFEIEKYRKVMFEHGTQEDVKDILSQCIAHSIEVMHDSINPERNCYGPI